MAYNERGMALNNVGLILSVLLAMAHLLTEKIQYLAPDVDKLRKPSPPGQTSQLRPDGGNLPWILGELSETSPDSLPKSPILDPRQVR